MEQMTNQYSEKVLGIRNKMIQDITANNKVATKEVLHKKSTTSLMLQTHPLRRTDFLLELRDAGVFTMKQVQMYLPWKKS